MIIWGGIDAAPLNAGSRYNPTTDFWTYTSLGGERPPGALITHGGLDGNGDDRLGGSNGASPMNNGGRYNPSTDSWIATSTGANVPVFRQRHSSVWTGTKMIVSGGLSSTGIYLNSGGRYDPSSNTWVATSTGTNVPLPRNDHTAVWTGTKMIVWGGRSSVDWNTGGRYDPSTDTWEATFTGANVPEARYRHAAVWTGTEMIVWGGGNSSGGFPISTGRYDPSTNSWTPVTGVGGVAAPLRPHRGVDWGRDDRVGR